MTELCIEQVIATHRHEWGKWPDSDDKDYSTVKAQRSEWRFVLGDRTIIVRNRFYPVYSAYVGAGDFALPVKFPVINNLFYPSAAVLEQQRRDLKDLS